MLELNFLVVEDKVALLESRLVSSTTSPRADTAAGRVIVSGILPPPPAICRLFDRAKIRVVANDIASLHRSYARMPATWQDVADYYIRLYADHFPCTTLLHTADRRAEAIMNLVSERKADGFVFVGEKFCEYEYFEMPYLEKVLKDAGIAVLSIEVSIDDRATVETFRTRIEAFAELLAG